jgi:DNA-binding NtrC family response regulator
VTRVGGLKARPIDVRFVAATNRNLELEVAAGRFRRDLYFRLNGMTLHIPPLRARRGEIQQLARLFLRQFAEQLKRRPPELDADAHRLMDEYLWPGNVRELRNMMERAALLSSGDVVRPEHLLLETMSAAADGSRADWAPAAIPDPSLAAAAGRPTQPMSVPADGDVDAERDHILRVLAQHGGNQSRAAKALGMARSTLVLRLNSYNIPRPRK